MKIKCLAYLSLVAFLAFTIAACQTKPIKSRVLRTSVTSIVNHPREFDGKTVEFEAFIVTSMHASVLFDENSHGMGIALYVPKKLNSLVVDEIIGASFSPEATSEEKRVWAVFSGKIELKANGSPSIVLMLSDVHRHVGP